MSMMICSQCNIIVDTDLDCDSLYIPGFHCVCEACRDRLNLEPEYDDPEEALTQDEPWEGPLSPSPDLLFDPEEDQPPGETPEKA